MIRCSCSVSHQSNLYTTPNETSKHSKKRFLLLAILYIEIFDVSRPNPQVVFYLRYTRQDFFIMGGIGDIGEHRGLLLLHIQIGNPSTHNRVDVQSIFALESCYCKLLSLRSSCKVITASVEGDFYLHTFLYFAAIVLS